MKQVEKTQLKEYLKTVKGIAYTYSKKCSVPFEDLIQIGSIGMLKALDKFNNKVNNDFTEFAKQYIVGEIKHYLRDSQYLVRIPRNIQEVSYKVSKLIKLGLTYAEVAEKLCMPVNKVENVMSVYNMRHVSSLDNRGDDNMSILDTLEDKTELNTNDTTMLLHNALNKLDNKYQQVIKLMYFKDMKQIEISKTLNIHPMQISRLIATGLDKLKQELQAV